MSSAPPPGTTAAAGSPQDEELDEDERQLKALFEQYQLNGFISMEDLASMLPVLELPNDPEQYDQLITNPQEIDEASFLAIISAIRSSIAIMSTGEEVKSIVTEKIVPLSFGDYMKRLLTCSLTEGETKYVLGESVLSLTPSQRIVIALLVTLLTCLFASGAVMAWLWIDYADKEATAATTVSGSLIAGCFTKMEEATLEVVEEELLLAAAITKSYLIREQTALLTEARKSVALQSALAALAADDNFGRSRLAFGKALTMVSRVFLSTTRSMLASSTTINGTVVVNVTAQQRLNSVSLRFAGQLRRRVASHLAVTAGIPPPTLVVDGTSALETFVFDLRTNQTITTAANVSAPSACHGSDCRTSVRCVADLLAASSSDRPPFLTLPTTLSVDGERRSFGVAFGTQLWDISASNNSSNASASVGLSSIPVATCWLVSLPQWMRYGRLSSPFVGQNSLLVIDAATREIGGFSSVILPAFDFDAPEPNGLSVGATATCADVLTPCADLAATLYGAYYVKRVAETSVTLTGSEMSRLILGTVQFDAEESGDNVKMCVVATPVGTTGLVHLAYRSLNLYMSQDWRPYGILRVEMLNAIRVQYGTTEVVFFSKSGPKWSQASIPALPFGCIAACSRFDIGTISAQFAEKSLDGTSKTITVDYRPEPVLSCGSKLSPTVVISVERDVIEVRSFTFNRIVGSIAQFNSLLPSTMEIGFLHRKGEFFTKTYDPSVACPNTATCPSIEGFGILYRDDCVPCTRQLPVNTDTGSIEFVTKSRYQCPVESTNCSMAALQQLNLYNVAANTTTPQTLRSVDYRNVPVLAYVDRLDNFSVAIHLTVTLDSVFGPIYYLIYIAIGVGLGITGVSTAALVLFARGVLRTIQSDWKKYKGLIVCEKRIYNEHCSDVIPPAVASIIRMTGPAFTLPANVSVAFCELVKLGNRESIYDPPELIPRFLTYVYHATERFARRWDIYRLHVHGDCTIYLSGLPKTVDAETVEAEAQENAEQQDADAQERESGKANDDVDTDKKNRNVSGSSALLAADETEPACPSAEQMLSFFVNVSQLFSARYAHYPYRCPLIASTFGGTQVSYPDAPADAANLGTIDPPQFRVGIHSGPAVLTMLRFTRGVPHFDGLGPTMGIARKLMASSKDGCIRISEAAFDTVTSKERFQLGKREKVLVGRSTVPSFLVVSGLVRIFRPLLGDLGVRYAKVPRVFTNAASKDGRGGGETGRSGSSRHSSRQSSEMSFRGLDNLKK